MSIGVIAAKLNAEASHFRVTGSVAQR